MTAEARRQAASAHAVRSNRGSDAGNTTAPKMLPGQEPYTPEELAALYETVSWAAQYIEDHPEEVEPLDIEQYTVYNTQTGERKRDRVD